MESSPKRSASVTVAAIVAILGSVIILLCCSLAFFAFLLAKMSGPASELPPALRFMMLGMQGLMICLSLFGVATGIGLLYLRNWARTSILTLGGLSVFCGVIGIPLALLIPISPTPNTPDLPAESTAAIRLVFLVMYCIPLLTGSWWLFLFNRESVKTQFRGARVSADPDVLQKPICPLPISVLAWFYITSILNILFLPFVPAHAPIFVFGKILPHSVGLTVLILSCLAFTVSGVGLLKLKPWSYSLTIGLQVSWLASTVVSMLSPNYKAAMQSLLEQEGTSLYLPEFQFSSTTVMQYLNLILIFGLLLAGAVLGVLVYYRPRFLKEAARAASAS